MAFIDVSRPAKTLTALCCLSLAALLPSTSFGVGLGEESNRGTYRYSGDTGPGYWYEINPPNACLGDMQTPLNITRTKRDRNLLPLNEYNLVLTPAPIRMINTDHTLMQLYDPGNGNSIEWEGLTYELIEFHFHSFAEHTVQNHRYPMELHSVFLNDQFEEGPRLLVIGTFFKIGHPNPFLRKLIKAGLPEKSTSPPTHGGMIDIADALTNLKHYYNYQGSLTTPGCEEIVTWVVQRQPAQMTEKQFEAFRTIMGNNFRPLQERNGRVIRTTVNRKHWWQ